MEAPDTSGKRIARGEGFTQFLNVHLGSTIVVPPMKPNCVADRYAVRGDRAGGHAKEKNRIADGPVYPAPAKPGYPRIDAVQKDAFETGEFGIEIVHRQPAYARCDAAMVFDTVQNIAALRIGEGCDVGREFAALAVGSTWQFTLEFEETSF